MYGHLQECARKAAERHGTQDLEKRLAQLYAGLEGGEDCADLTGPRGALRARCIRHNARAAGAR